MPPQYQQPEDKSNAKLFAVIGIIVGAIFLIAIISVLLVQNKLNMLVFFLTVCQNQIKQKLSICQMNTEPNK